MTAWRDDAPRGGAGELRARARRCDRRARRRTTAKASTIVTTLRPSADTYLARKPKGASQNIAVGSGLARSALLSFDLSRLPSEAVIVDARLRLFWRKGVAPAGSALELRPILVRHGWINLFRMVDGTPVMYSADEHREWVRQLIPRLQEVADAHRPA